MSASNLIVRIGVGYDDKGNPDNLVAYNRGLTTLQLLELLVKQAKQGMPQANALWRFDENPVAASGSFTISSGSGTLHAVIGGIDKSVVWATSDTHTGDLLVTAIAADATLSKLVSAVNAAGVVTVTAIGSAVGLVGNAITTTGSGTGMTANQAALAGGTDGTAQVASASASQTFTASSASGDLVAVIGGQHFIRAHASSDDADTTALASLVNEPCGRLPYISQTGNFTAKLTVTGATSGATGVIASDQDNGTTGALDLQNVAGNFLPGEIVTDSSTGSATVGPQGLQGTIFGKVVASDNGAGVMTVTSKLPGAQGNGVTTTATGTGFTAGGATMTGGADPINTQFTF